VFRRPHGIDSVQSPLSSGLHHVRATTADTFSTRSGEGREIGQFRNGRKSRRRLKVFYDLTRRRTAIVLTQTLVRLMRRVPLPPRARLTRAIENIYYTRVCHSLVAVGGTFTFHDKTPTTFPTQLRASSSYCLCMVVYRYNCCANSPKTQHT